MNKNLNKAKYKKNDEYYTIYNDIEEELNYYKDFLKDKVIFCNTDHYKHSNFVKYFKDNFNNLGIKKLNSLDITGNLYSYDGSKEIISNVETGDFRGEDSIKILKESDIVITNPPFSLFREFVDIMFEYNKDFIIIGNYNAISYKDIFHKFTLNKISLGYSKRGMNFITENGVKNVNSKWFTSFPVSFNRDFIKLTEQFSEYKYEKFDNYNAINVDRVNLIPKDYYDVMGVPITYLEKHNPNQFEILGITLRSNKSEYRNKIYSEDDHINYNDMNGSAVLKINGEYVIKYKRVLIRRKR